MSVNRFIKFLIIGVLNTAIDWGVLNVLLLITKTETSLGFALCKAIGFSCAMLNSYYWNKKWVFQDPGQSSPKKAGIFVGVNLIGLGINVGIATVVLRACQNWIPIGEWQFLVCSNFGAVIATGASLLWNFTGYRLFVFK